jgi:hypothetical protein
VYAPLGVDTRRSAPCLMLAARVGRGRVSEKIWGRIRCSRQCAKTSTFSIDQPHRLHVSSSQGPAPSLHPVAAAAGGD